MFGFETPNCERLYGGNNRVAVVIKMAPVCSNCGNTVRRTAKFCKYCGRPLTSRSSSVSRRDYSPSPTSVTRSRPVTEIPADVLSQLELRGQLLEIEKEEKELMAEIEKLQAELEKGEQSIAEIEEKMKPLKKSTKELTKKEKKLKAKIKPFPFEEAGKARHLWSERLEKLEELKQEGTTRESVYRRLKGEYETGLREAEEKYQEQLILTKEWLLLLKSQYAAARDELAMLEARHEVGEVSEGVHEKNKETLQKRTLQLGRQVEILETILRGIK